MPREKGLEMAFKIVGGLSAVVAVTLALAACGGAEGGAAPNVAPVEATVTATTVVTETVTVSPEPEPEPVVESSAAVEDVAAGGKLLIGDTHDGKAGASLQVLDFKVVEEYGMVSSGVKVSACNNTDAPVTFSSELWVGFDAEGGRYTPGAMTSGDLKPAYPYSTFEATSETDPGDCLVGWILYDVGDLASVRYKSEANGTATWELPAS